MTKKERNKVIEAAIAGGAIGAVLGAIVTGKKKDSFIAALVGAAIGASRIALDEAKELDVPVLYDRNGNREVIKKRNHKNRIYIKKLPTSFSLE